MLCILLYREDNFVEGKRRKKKKKTASNKREEGALDVVCAKEEVGGSVNVFVGSVAKSERAAGQKVSKLKILKNLVEASAGGIGKEQVQACPIVSRGSNSLTGMR